jgi:hypothetical protein
MEARIGKTFVHTCPPPLPSPPHLPNLFPPHRSLLPPSIAGRRNPNGTWGDGFAQLADRQDCSLRPQLLSRPPLPLPCNVLLASVAFCCLLSPVSVCLVQVMVEYGKPIEVPWQLVLAYRYDKMMSLLLPLDVCVPPQKRQARCVREAAGDDRGPTAHRHAQLPFVPGAGAGVRVRCCHQKCFRSNELLLSPSWKLLRRFHIPTKLLQVTLARRLYQPRNLELSADDFLKLQRRFTMVCSFFALHYTTLHSTTLHYTPLHSTSLHYTTLHFTTLHYTPLHYTTLHCTTPTVILGALARSYSLLSSFLGADCVAGEARSGECP